MPFIYGTQAGAGSFTGGNITGSTTVDSPNTLSVAAADSLLVNSIIVPQTKTVTFVIDSATAATGQYLFFIADEAYQMTAFRATWSEPEVASSTLMPKKLTGTQDPDAAGINMLTAAIALDGTANTVFSGSLSATASDLQLAVGDRIGLLTANFSGASLFSVIITLKRI